MNGEEIRLRAAEMVAAGPGEPVVARDPINLPMIHNWVEALGEQNPIYLSDEAARAEGHEGIVAPPAMLQVWTMGGMQGAHGPDDPITKGIDLLNDAGCTAVVATNCRQRYDRYRRPGERVSLETSIVGLSELKRTALGEGYFLSSSYVWRSDLDGKQVGEMDFRLFKYRPGSPTRDPAGAHRASAGAPGGRQLQPMCIEATPTFVIASALATRDFQDVHHDRDAAQSYGSKDIFVNILTDTGLVQRFATDWAGPGARVGEVGLVLRVPCYAYDTLTFTGTATGGSTGPATVRVWAAGQLGIHVVGTVQLTR